MPPGSVAVSRTSSRGPPSSRGSRPPSQANGVSAAADPSPRQSSNGHDRGAVSTLPAHSAAAASAAAGGPSDLPSPSARPRDVVASYLRELYGGAPPTRLLAAQGLGALPSFLPAPERPAALRLGVELGVVGGLADVLVADEEQEVQEACLVALSSLLFTTAPHEQHSAPPGMRPQYLRLLGPSVLRPEVLDMMGYLLAVTSSPRVVLAAARVMAILAPHVSQVNDIHVIDSRIIPALLAAVAASPPPEQPPGGAEGAGSIATPRDSAACALALLALAEATPDLYVTICTADLFQALSVLYGRCVDPGQASNAVLPADAASLLLRALTLSPPPHWAARLPKGHFKAMERHVQESDALECLVSCVAVEAANLRRLGEGLAEAVAANARAVVAKNGFELEHLQARVKEAQRRQAEAHDVTAEARRGVEAAEANAANASAAAAAADADIRAARNGGTVEQRRLRREAEGAAARAAEAAVERRRALAAAEAAEAARREEVTALRKAAGPLRWQSERMAKVDAAAQAWLSEHGSRRSKVKVSLPHMGLLQQLLAFLAAQVAPSAAARPERPISPRGGIQPPPPPTPGPSPEHTEVVHAKLLAGGLVQAVVRLYSVLGALRSLAGEVAGLAAELGWAADMGAALEGAAGSLAREAAALVDVQRRAKTRMAQVDLEAGKLRKALRLGTAQGGSSGGGASPRAAMQLGPGNGLSRGVRQDDVAARLQALEAEGLELTTVASDVQSLRELLQDRMQALSNAASALTDSQAAFLKAFPSQAAPVTPTRAPTAAASNAARASPRSPAGSPRPGRSSPGTAPGGVPILPPSLLPKDPSHPAGQLLGVLIRSLDAVVTHGSSNLPALLRQLLGKAPSAGGALGPETSQAGSGPALQHSASCMSFASGNGAVASPRGLSKSPSAQSSLAAPQAALGARPSSAPARSRAAAFGGAGAIHGCGPYPVDAVGRPMRFPAESMYSMIQHTQSPLRGYSAPNNGPRFALLRLRDSAIARQRQAPLNGTGADASAASSPALSASPSAAALGASGLGLPVAEESRRLLEQAATSVLFDSVVGLEPTAAAAQGGGLSARSSRSSIAPVRADGVASGNNSAAAAGGAEGEGSGMSVLDALLMQSERLCGVLDRLAALQVFFRATCRSCRQLPAGLTYASLQPGQLGPFMAQLHAMWAEALTHHADCRVPVARCVTEIAELGLVPGAEFEAVYRDTGMLQGLMRMLAGQMRPPGKAEPKAPDAGNGAPAAAAATAAAAAAAKPRTVARLSAAAPPTLRPGAAQQAEQAAAARALLALRTAQPDALDALAQDDKLLRQLCTLTLDHSLSWPARAAACDVLADLILGGGPAAEAAVRAGAFAGLSEAINRDCYPFMNQDPTASKASVVSALAAMASHTELLEGVVAAAQTSGGPSSGLPLDSPDQVFMAILRSLWGVCAQAQTTYSSDRTGNGRHVDPGMASALLSTACTAAHELAVLADTSPEARRALREELRLPAKISVGFMQAIKDQPLYEALVQLRKNLS